MEEPKRQKITVFSLDYKHWKGKAVKAIRIATEGQNRAEDIRLCLLVTAIQGASQVNSSKT
jgi:hypothetical protein